MAKASYKKIAILIFFILSIQVPWYAKCLSSDNSTEFKHLSRNQLKIYTDEQIKGAAQEVLTLYPEIKKRLEAFFGWKFQKYPIHIVIRSRLNRPKTSLLVAYAVPAKNLVVIDYFRAGSTPTNLKVTLEHELCHLLLHSHINDSSLPKWLDEGICQVVSGSLGELAIIPKASVLDKAVRSRKIIPLEKLETHFPNQRDALLLAYEESKSFTSYLIEMLGKQALLELLNYLRDGETFKTGFLQAASKPFSEMEREWWSSLEKQDSLLARLSYYLYELLFAFGAAITIYAFVRQWRERKNYEDEEISE